MYNIALQGSIISRQSNYINQRMTGKFIKEVMASNDHFNPQLAEGQNIANYNCAQT